MRPSAYGEHDFHDGVEHRVDLVLAVPAALHAEGHGPHLVHRDAFSALEVAGDLVGHEVDFVDPVAVVQPAGAGEALLLGPGDAVEHFLTELAGSSHPGPRARRRKGTVPLPGREGVLESPEGRVNRGDLVALPDEREGNLPHGGGIERGLPVTFERRARGLEEAVDGRGLVALAPAGGARERRGHGLGAHAATRGKNRKYIARATTADGRMESRR